VAELISGRRRRRRASAGRDAIPVYVWLLRAKDLIDREYARPLDVPALAREAHASTAHFSRSFKRVFGETPYQYLLRRRIERAKELLRGTDLTVDEVTFEVGLQSVGAFSTSFRKLVGEPPGADARRWRAATPPAIPGCFTLMHTRPVPSSSSRDATTPARD
jgi:AraC-like DNA-binding protein